MRPITGITMAAVTLLLPLRGQAADTPATPAKAVVAADFLEYLATFEGDDENWTDFEVLEDDPPAAQAKPATPQASKAGDPE